MKLDPLCTLSLNDISITLSDAEKEDNDEEDDKGNEEEGGTRETLCQLRKRSRKRRSFIETDFTSRVSYPEPEKRQDLVLSRFHNNILADPSDVHLLSSDPEPSEQTKNPSPTISLLTHSEGEPAQLESKPILSKAPKETGSPEQLRDGQHPTGNRRPEMEMEPDAMESKSVTDILKAASPTITVVRCRVDPDGKECSDWQGYGKEEAGSQDKSDEEKLEEETVTLAGNSSFTSHKLLPKISEEKEKDGSDEAEEPGILCSTTNQEDNDLATCLKGINTKSSNGLPGAHFIAPQTNSNTETLTLKSVLSYSPPPPPPSSPLPPTPQRNNYPVKESEFRENEGTSNQILLTDPKDKPPCQQYQSGKLHLHFDIGKRENEEEAVSVVSDEVTDSINSDNVFEDDDMSISLNSASSDRKYDWGLAARRSISASFAALGKGESQVKHLHTSMETHKRLHSLNNDYAFAIRSITEKLGAATSATSPTFNSGAEVRSDMANESDQSLNEMADKPSSTSSFGETCNSLSPIFTKATADGIHNLSKCPPSSPTHFLFQTCSPSLIGRLSASTLRGKIQKLPLYLSRSQESLHTAGEVNTTEGPVVDNTKDKVEITITDENDITQTVGFETDTTAESDDSDTTVTGSEVDGEFYIELEPGKRCCTSLEEINELSSAAPPIQTEPRAQHHKPPDSGLNTSSTPGPITEPPTSILNSLQRDSPRPQTDQTGHTKQLTPSISTGIVVTTQNLNGPGVQFQNQALRRTSRDRPLIALCGPTEPHLESPNKQKSLSCQVFTVCEDSPQSHVTAEIQPIPTLKPELGCSSAMGSGCETVAEGLQVPLDACGCPPAYTNCFIGSDSFDEELTVYEFSCRSQGSDVTQTSGAVPLVTSPPAPSFLSVSSSRSPFSTRPNFFSSSTSELSPLLSPLSDTSHCFPSPTHKDIVSRLGQQHYPEPPAGFQVLRVDVDQLLSVLEGSSGSAEGHGGRHPRDTCPAHFTENKRVLQTEAKRLTSNCQKVVGTGQSPEEMLRSLAESFRTLVGLAVVCLWFSGCDRCDRRNTEAVAGLADVARSFRDFCLAAERVSSKRSCQVLSTKLLAKQCTALTASVFCLTQIFRTLTAL